MAATKRRSLADLYTKEQPLTIDDGKGPVNVILRKLNPVDQETAFRRANAARATVVAAKKNPDSEEYQDIINSFIEFDVDEIIDILAGGEMAKRSGALEAEVAENGKWLEDDYLQGLSDAWSDVLEEREKTEPEDADVVRVKAELERFDAEVEAQRARELEAAKDELRAQNEEKLRKRLVDVMLTMRADAAWQKEFSRCEIWKGTVWADDKTRMFQHRHEVDVLDKRVIDQLLFGLSELLVDVTEGKDSPGTPASSPSSEQSETEETEELSGREVATV